MDTPAKRRSIFGGLASSIFGRSQATTSDTTKTETKPATRQIESDHSSQQEDKAAVSSKAREEHHRKVDASNMPSIPRPHLNAEPESPAKRATASQLSSRRIIGRPQGPSGKLSHSISASDFGNPKKTTFSSIASSSMTASKTNPTRMPGDNPNKYNTISGSTFSRPTRPTPDFSGLSGTATTPRNVFRASSTARARPDFSFSPKVPYKTAKESFPPTTPGKPSRGSTADLTGRSLVHAKESSSLFEMRIPSPPRDLTGERLAKEMPEDKNRVGSVYAGEFLSHYCPPDFDDLQRRQFFCVLDLRRLKYAADEVFAKKDWKINILNFAKEYEKSRSLIMLRYGLYEFKTIKASQAVKNQWKKDNNIPLSDGEEDDEEQEEEPPRRITNGQTSVAGSKRKAEEELVPKDVPVKSSNPNKRAVTEQARERLDQVATSATSTPKPKRKADDLGEADENPPSKLQKSTTTATPSTLKASATKSIFESIANGTPKESSKAAPAPTFAKPMPCPANPFGSVLPAAGNSVLGQPSLAASTNIFGHLSDTSKASSNDADEESSDEGEGTSPNTDGEAQESEVQGASPSDAASGGVATPQFSFQGKLTAPKDSQPVSSASSDAGGSTQGRSLFDRITRDKDGQPVRVGQKEATPQPTLSATPPTDQSATPAPAPAPVPANKTWSTDTPIKFAPGPSQPAQSNPIFGSATPKPNGLFGAPSEAPKAAPAIIFEPPTPAKEAERPAASTEAPQPASKPMFGAAFGATASTPATSLFGSNSGSSLFGQAKPAEEKKANAPVSTPSSIFGSRLATPSPAPEAPKPVTSALFGANPATTESEAPKPASTSLFAQKPAETEAAKPASVFQSSSLFGNAAQSVASKSPSPQPSSLFGAAPKAPETSTTPAPAVGFTFGASTPAASATAARPATSMFGSNSGQSSNLFGAKPAEFKPLFGAAPASSNPTPSPVFGAAPQVKNEPAKQPTSIFANQFGATSAAPPAFGASQSTVPSTSFGASASQPHQDNTQSQGNIFGNTASNTSSFTFNAGGSQQQAQTSFNNPFAGNGDASTPSSFNFGATGNANTGPPSTTPFSFSGGNAQAPPISFGAGPGASTPTSTQQTSMFGGGANASTSFGSSSNFAFSGTQSQQPPSGGSMFGAQPALQGGNMFTAGGLAPSTGTNTPLFGGASSLATTPGAGTPEPAAGGEKKAEEDANQGTQADGDDAPQEQQLSLLDGVLPGEELEDAVHEVRAKALKLEVGGDDKDGSLPAKSKSASPWVTKGVGPLRLLKNKETGKVRMLLRAAPGGQIALNKMILPNFTYKPEASGGKYVKITTANDTGKGLETWMFQVKTKELAQALADALEEHKTANAKKD